MSTTLSNDRIVTWVTRPKRPEGREGRSQRGPKGHKLEDGARRAPKLLVLYILTIDFGCSLCNLSGGIRYANKTLRGQIFLYILILLMVLSFYTLVAHCVTYRGASDMQIRLSGVSRPHLTLLKGSSGAQ